MEFNKFINYIGDLMKELVKLNCSVKPSDTAGCVVVAKIKRLASSSGKSTSKIVIDALLHYDKTVLSKGVLWSTNIKEKNDNT